MKLIPLTRGHFAKVDDDDFDYLSQWKWQSNGRRYATRFPRINGKRKWIWMHREIIGAPNGLEVDHINLDRLDNRKSNLRIATHGQNQQNCTAYKTNKFGAKGVCWHKSTQKYYAQIVFCGKKIYLGVYEQLSEAKAAYNSAAAFFFGEFARF